MTAARPRIGYVGVGLDSYFAEEHDQYGRAVLGLREMAHRMDVELVAVEEGVTDVERARNVAGHLRAENLDFLLLQNASCSSGEVLLPFVDVAPRMGLWATPDPASSGTIQLHSLVSMNHYASIMRRHLRDDGVPFKWYFGHIGDTEMDRRLEVTLRSLRGIKAMANATIGWVGGYSPGFYNMGFDPDNLFNRFGTRIGTHEIAEVVELAKAASPTDTDAVIEHAVSIAAEVTAPPLGLNRNARLYLALKRLIEDNGYDALAVECWPTFQDDFDIAPCMAYSLLGSEDGVAVSCEGDVPGSVTMLLLNSMSDNPGSSTLLDLTAIDQSSDSALLWHCGVTPRHFADDNGIRWVDHVTLGRKTNVRIGVSGDQVFAPRPTTMAYAGDEFSEMLVVSTDIVERSTPGFDGTRAWFSNFRLNGEPIKLMDLVNTLVVRGHEHHYAVAQDDLTSELIEVAAWLGMRTVEPVPLRDHLQREGVNA